MIQSSSIETLPANGSVERDKLTHNQRLALVLRLETGPSTKIRCKGGYHFKIVEFEGKLYAAIPCSHKRCKRGGVSGIHIFALDSGNFIDTLYEDAAYPEEILGHSDKVNNGMTVE
jgi:hypothetical protein